MDGDGCSAKCEVEHSWTCSGGSTSLTRLMEFAAIFAAFEEIVRNIGRVGFEELLLIGNLYYYNVYVNTRERMHVLFGYLVRLSSGRRKKIRIVNKVSCWVRKIDLHTRKNKI